MGYKRTAKDMAYEAEKNKFLKRAEGYANEIHGASAHGGKAEYDFDWNRTFLKEMKKLAREAGLNAY